MNYLKWSYSLLILIIVFSIQTKDLMPNVMELLPPNQHRKLASLALTDTWSSKYKQATRLQKKSPQLACPLFSQLSQQPHFPLNKIAFLRAHENCSQKEKLANKLKPLNYSALPQWLQPLALNYVIKQSRQKKDYEKSFEYMLIKSKLPLPLKEKVQHTKEALNIAKTHQLKSNLRKSLQRLYKLAPRLIPNPTKINFLKIAHDYKRSQFFSLARAYYRKVFKLRGFSYSQKIIALKGIEKTYKLENKKKLYLSTAKQLAQFATKNLILYPHKKFLARSVNNLNNSYARKLWTSGKIKLAKSILLKNTKLLKNKISLHKSYWILSRMASEKKQHLAAIWWLEQAKGEPRINSHAQNNIYWHLFWNYKKLKQTKSAITIIDEAISKNTKHKQKFSFWKAKILKDNGHYLQANTLFKTIVEADTLGYYGLLAHRELNLKITKPTRPIDDMGHSINKSYKISRVGCM